MRFLLLSVLVFIISACASAPADPEAGRDRSYESRASDIHRSTATHVLR